MRMKTLLVPAVASLVLAGCGADMNDGTFSEDVQGEAVLGEAEVLGQATAALASNQQCDTVPPQKVLNRGGEFTSPRSYNPAGCPDAYLVTLNNYGGENNLGTFVGWGDAEPTTKGECERTRFAVIVWRLRSSGNVLLGHRSENGAWTTSPGGVQYCETPYLNIDDEISGYAYGGDYRIGMRAQLNTTDGTSYSKRKIYFGTRKLN